MSQPSSKTSIPRGPKLLLATALRSRGTFDTTFGMAPRARFVVPFLFAVTSLACAASKPKQHEDVDPLHESGQDIAPADTSAADGAKKDVAAEEAMHTKCCGQCKEALSKDRSGQSADSIPCADYSDLQPWCTEHFRVTPTMASACQ